MPKCKEMSMEYFFEMIERWRVLLAGDISLHNEEMSEEELTSCVQKIIDRVLFLRICEDKEIELLKQLQKVIETASIYATTRMQLAKNGS